MSELIACPTCQAAVPHGAFCSVCGASLAAAVPATGPAEPAPAPVVHGPAAATTSILADPVAARTNAGIIRRNPAVAVGILALVGAGVWFAHSGDHTIEGDITVIDDGYYSSDDGESCSTDGGYSDIATGRQVLVTDEDGSILATSSLESGTVEDGFCTFPFTIEKVGKANYYEVSTGNSNRGGLTVSADELAAQGWTVHLSLGD